MSAWNYRREPLPQFYAYLIGTENMVPVYRWWHPIDKDWVTLSDTGEISDDQMLEWGYERKTFQFFAHRTQVNGTVPVYRWWHEGDRDWVTIAEGELSDSDLLNAGYTKRPTPLFYAFRSKPVTSGYFSLGAATTVLTKSTWNAPDAPHTMSVVEPTMNNRGFRFWGYYGLQGCGGIGIARSNDLINWAQEPGALFTGNGERWPSVLLDNNKIYMAHTVNFGSCVQGHASHIVLRDSTDGMNFSAPTPLVAEENGFFNQNPALFRDPLQARFFLYWYRGANALWEIRAKSAPTIEGLATAESQLVAWAPITVAAPQVMYFNGRYYLAVETEEQGGIWMTRVLTSTMPDRGFAEIPSNPVLGDGTACFFQHILDNKLHAYYCKQTGDVWTLDYRYADLTEV